MEWLGVIVALLAGVWLIWSLRQDSYMYTQWRNTHGAYYTVIDEDGDLVTLLSGVGTLTVTKERLHLQFTRVEDVGSGGILQEDTVKPAEEGVKT